MNNEFLNSTLAIVVLYNQKIEDSKTLISLEKALHVDNILDLIIYDNSRIDQEVKNLKFKKFRITYFHNPGNPGVSYAYNFAAEYAKKQDKKWLLLLDQDTCFENNIFQSYYNSVKQNINIALFAPILKINESKILSPCKFHFYGEHLKSINFELQRFDNNSPVNSGIFVKIDSFLEAGGYNNNVPLDLSDHQFIERFKKKNKYYIVVNSIGYQNFSAIEDNKDKQLIRFNFYCQGILNFESDKINRKMGMVLFMILKAFKKSFQYKTYSFFVVMFNQFGVWFKNHK